MGAQCRHRRIARNAGASVDMAGRADAMGDRPRAAAESGGAALPGNGGAAHHGRYGGAIGHFSRHPPVLPVNDRQAGHDPGALGAQAGPVASRQLTEPYQPG